MPATKPACGASIRASLGLLLIAGCAHTTAPRDWLPDADKAQQQAYGGWITVEYRTDTPPLQRCDGELIAVSADSVYVLDSNATLCCISLATVEKAKIMAYNAHASTLGAWTLLGCLSTASHGIVAGITAPVWFLGGGCATILASKQPQVVYENPLPGEGFPTARSWDDLRPFARFPFGLPPNLDRASLTPKFEEARPAVPTDTSSAASERVE